MAFSIIGYRISKLVLQINSSRPSNKHSFFEVIQAIWFSFYINCFYLRRLLSHLSIKSFPSIYFSYNSII